MIGARGILTRAAAWLPGPPRAPAPWQVLWPAAEDAPGLLDTCRIGGHRFRYTRLERVADAPPAGPDHPGHPTPPSVALALLDRRRGFVDALSEIYGRNLHQGFERLTLIQHLSVGRRFLEEPRYRRRILASLCRRTLGPGGLLMIRPAPGICGGRTPTQRLQPNETLAVCGLFGAAGFAQLCDDLLEEPIPLFVQPWQREAGWIAPSRLPARSYSRKLCGRPLQAGRRVLFDNAAATAGTG